MDVIFTHCAGLDVHKKSVMACRLIPDPTGKQTDGLMEVREFGTLTIDLLALSDWLAEAGVTHVAMESTAEYWKPVFNLLEGNFQVFLVDAAHVKRVPGGRPIRPMRAGWRNSCAMAGCRPAASRRKTNGICGI